MTLRHKTRFNTSGQGFKKDPIRSMLALIANRVFFKSVKTSFVTKGHGQGVLKRKKY